MSTKTCTNELLIAPEFFPFWTSHFFDWLTSYNISLSPVLPFALKSTRYSSTWYQFPTSSYSSQSTTKSDAKHLSWKFWRELITRYSNNQSPCCWNNWGLNFRTHDWVSIWFLLTTGLQILTSPQSRPDNNKIR